MKRGPIIVAAAQANGGSVLLTSLNFFGYFTILSNLLAAVGLVTQLVAPASTAGRFFSRPTVRAGTAELAFVEGAIDDASLGSTSRSSAIGALASEVVASFHTR